MNLEVVIYLITTAAATVYFLLKKLFLNVSILVDIRDGLHEESSVINITYGKNTKVYSK